ncbi:hypothetical protein FA95DRAFT_1674566 [Auriscalpium vulgare]|uniref:Uncharacterized protein n=1 Tax=Auriscalpium vulgare TaxID=40419 RepID=A0ACB8SB33_9AGAM|nr:hypothetical protein FA95DRAFT_1674566 [Auriscalpium vulgare]
MLLSALCSTEFTSLVLVLLLCLSPASAQQSRPANDSATLCRPFGPCEPCPSDALSEPFCQPFGNRRLVHCSAQAPSSLPPDSLPHEPLRPPSHDTSGPPESQPQQGETPAWESCGRIVEQERADFLEFVACNVLFVGGALFLVLARTKRLRAQQARQLAARIGLVRG